MGEPNETDIDAYVEHICGALRPKLVGPGAIEGDVVFVGDSWGSLAAYTVAQRLREQVNFSPDHMVISGNASPTIASEHAGLGSFSDTPIAELSDADLEEFLKSSGVDEVGLAKSHSGSNGDKSASAEGSAIMEAMVAALRADCQLYEDFRRDPSSEPLLCNALVLRGTQDAVVKAPEMTGWADEFCGDVRRAPRAHAPHAMRTFGSPSARGRQRPRTRAHCAHTHACARVATPCWHSYRRKSPSSRCPTQATTSTSSSPIM